MDMICKTIHLNEHFSFLQQENCDAQLDVYLPHNSPERWAADRRRPCLVICPGGGYGFVSEREGEPVAFRFLPRGYNVFVLKYSIAPHCRFPQQLLEVAAVMELIHSNAEEWSCDTDKIAIMGFSAGGHLAGSYSTMYDCPEVREHIKDSKKPAASILCYAVLTAGPFAHMGSFQNLLGHETLTEAEIERFSLENRVSASTPPTFLWHTAADDGVPVENSLLYASSLSRHKVPFELHVYPQGHHGLSTADRETCGDFEDLANKRVTEWVDAAGRWLDLLFYGQL